jgi:elongation factor 1-beta
MGFENLNSEAGLAALNGYMADKSYIEGFAPSQADVAVFEAVGTLPSTTKFAHAARWYNHITSHKASFAS